MKALSPFVMLLLCHSSECGSCEFPSLFCSQELLLYFSFTVVTLHKGMKAGTIRMRIRNHQPRLQQTQRQTTRVQNRRRTTKACVPGKQTYLLFEEVPLLNKHASSVFGGVMILS